MLYENIKRIARQKGVSIYRIEKDLDLSNGMISKWSTSTPFVTNIRKVADYLNVPLEELMQEENEKEVM